MTATPRVVDAVRGEGPEKRERFIVDVFTEAFAPFAARDQQAFRGKFRMMARSPLAFYRGAVSLYYADVARDDDAFVTDSSGHVWIQGDMHAENFGTYMNSEGRLVFDVNDFDEAYVGPFTWDLKRLAAGIALLGYEKALSDDEIVEMISVAIRSYVAQVKRFATKEHTENFALMLDNTTGRLLEVLRTARLRTRVALLDEWTEIRDYDRRFRMQPHTSAVDDDTRKRAEAAFDAYLETIPPRKLQNRVSYTIKDVMAVRGMGIGSAGLPSVNFLIEGHTQALENDIIVYMKQADVAAPSRVLSDERVRSYFKHQGHRTVVSQRALQAYADPWLGYSELNDAGQLVSELGPYVADLDWTDINDVDEILELLEYLGRAVAKIHCISDVDSEQTLIPVSTDEVISRAVEGREEELVGAMVGFGQHYGDLVRDDHQLFIDAFRNHRIMDL
jgi:uncharacterized protein (DUF2252 family)